MSRSTWSFVVVVSTRGGGSASEFGIADPREGCDSSCRICRVNERRIVTASPPSPTRKIAETIMYVV